MILNIKKYLDKTDTERVFVVNYEGNLIMHGVFDS